MKTDLLWSADVVVVGAGPAGIAAAVAAARNGAKTLLLEEDAVPGGCISDYYVAMLCGGPVTGIIAELEAICKEKYRLPNGTNWFTPADWQRGIRDLIDGEPNLRLCCGCRVTGVEREGKKIAALALNGDPARRVTGNIFIDSSGDGSFSALAGCEVMYGRDCRADFGEANAPETPDEQVQQLTWMYISQKLPGVPPFDMTRLEYARRGVLPQGMTWFHLKPKQALAQNDGIYLHWGCMTPCRDVRDPAALADAQAAALELMKHDHALLHANGYVVHLAPRIGVRESRRIKGRYVITVMDICGNTYPADTVACGNYPPDLWGETIRHEPVTGYGIPYRALLPLDVDNLLVAGKIISGSHLAMSAYRVMPIAGAIGQAAGTAAALAAAAQIRPDEVDVEKLRRTLAAQHLLLVVPPKA